jgi:hypothetical protein
MDTSLLPRSDRLNQKIKEAIARARSLSDQGKDQLAAAAWSEIEELRTKIAEQKAQVKTDFEQYCDDNPSAVGCLIYDV